MTHEDAERLAVAILRMAISESNASITEQVYPLYYHEPARNLASIAKAEFVLLASELLP